MTAVLERPTTRTQVFIAPRCPDHVPQQPRTCARCSMRAKTLDGARSAAKWAGEWEPLVPAAEAAAHLRHLEQSRGLAYLHQSEQSGVSYKHLLKIAAGEILQLHPDTARALLALQPSTDPLYIGKSDRINSIGVRRRLRGLVVDGWSFADLAKREGCTRQCVYHWSIEDESMLTTVKRIGDLTDDLWWTRGPDNRGCSAQAIRKGWVSLDAWGSEIDNPGAVPNIADPGSYVDDVKVAQATRGDVPADALTRAERSATVRVLTQRGMTDPEIATLLQWLEDDGGPATDSVHWWRRQHGIPAGVDWHRRRLDPARVAAAVAGDLPARELSTREREAAVRQLAGEGSSDREIAKRLRWAGKGRGMGAVQTFRIERGIEAGHPNGGRVRLPRSV
jgi:hypothetical protein